jgi:hypothetical protein
MIIQDLKWLRTAGAASSEPATNGLPEYINTKWISGPLYVRNRSCLLNKVIMGGFRAYGRSVLMQILFLAYVHV